MATRILELELSGRDCADSSRILKTLRRNVQHLESLVDKVLKESAHVQTEAGIRPERRLFDLWPLVESVILDLNPVASTASTKLLNAIPEELSIYADAGLVRRIFQNLLANAITYAPRGEVVIGARENDGSIECWVSDNGAGIPEDRLENIFKKLETDRQSEGGTGLGLAIVKTFVEAQGGKVTVETKEGEVTTFRLKFFEAAGEQTSSAIS
jgi:signal transduction histidine kinase